MNLIEEIARSSSEASLYEMLAEEAAELSASASKYARFLRGEQPVKEGLIKEVLFDHVIEEYADVYVSMTVIQEMYSEDLNVWYKVGEIAEEKMKRWRDRLEAKE
jgi:hypothetical protein